MKHSGKSSGNWKLTGTHAEQAQGLVVSGFSDLPTGRALFLQFQWLDQPQGQDVQGRSWLDRLQDIAPITSASAKSNPAAAIAFSFTGLQKMGLSEAALNSFSAPFCEGMFQEDRLRRLGDRRKGEWCKTVICGGPRWSGNTPQRGAIGGVEESHARPLTSTGHIEEQSPTPLTVHALLLLYDSDEAAADARARTVTDLLAEHSVAVVHRLPLELRVENGLAREHFGFADGISQPIPFDNAGAVRPGGAASPPDRFHGVPLGEFLFGHANGHHEQAPGPLLPKGAVVGKTVTLDPHPTAEGMLDLGLNGSYMVVRELKQNVPAFWDSMKAGAALIRRRDPDDSHDVTADWLAQRVVGRTRDGDLLCPAGFPVAQERPARQ